MSERLLTHSQYEELVKFEDGLAHIWLFGAPSKSLTTRGFLRVARYGYSRKDCSFAITDAGLAALSSYRARWGIRAHAEAAS